MAKDVHLKLHAKDKQLGNMRLFTMNSMSSASKELCNTIVLMYNKPLQINYPYRSMTGLPSNKDQETMNGLKTAHLSMRAVVLEIKMII